MPPRKLLTLHAPLGRLVTDPVLAALDGCLREQGITHWWISPEQLPDLVIMAEVDDDRRQN